MANHKTVTMKLSESGYKRFKSVMKKFGFINEDLFVKYCVLKTIKSKESAKIKRDIDKEIKLILAAKKRK